MPDDELPQRASSDRSLPDGVPPQEASPGETGGTTPTSWPFAAGTTQPLDPNEPIDAVRPLAALSLSLASIAAIKRAGARTNGELLKLTPQDLREAGFCGRKAMEDIRGSLGEYGLDLRCATPLSRRQLAKIRARGGARVSLAEFVVHEGRLDLRAIRETGTEEALELAGIPVRINLADGALYFPAATPAGDELEDGGWVGRIGQVGMDRPVRCLTEHEGRLVAAGPFSRAGGAAANGIACWNGNAWQPLGMSLRGHVVALRSFEGRLVAAGELAVGAGERCPAAAWDGSEWSPLGKLDDDGCAFATALLVHEGRLLASGFGLLDEGGQPARGVMAWDGRAWRPLSPDTRHAVWCLCEHRGRLFAGGHGVPGIVALWTGRDWAPVGGGLKSRSKNPFSLANVSAMVSHGNDLVVAGMFHEAGGIEAHGLAAWDGTRWHPLGERGGHGVSCLASWGDQLLAGGSLRRIADVEVGHLARWDGERWSAFGSGTNARICDLLVWGDTLVAGGWFTRAGDWPAHRIARWR